MGGLGEVHHQVTGAQLLQRDPRQARPLLLAGAGDRGPGVSPGLGRQARAVVRSGALRAPFVGLPDLLHRVPDGPFALLRRLAVVLAERTGRDQPLLRLRDAVPLQPLQGGEPVGGEGGQQFLDGGQPPAYGVAFLLLARRQGELCVEGGPRPARQPVGPAFAARQPADRHGPLARQLPDQMPLVEGVLRIAGEQQPQIRGDPGAALVLLAGQPSGRSPAVVQRQPRPHQADVQPSGLGAPPHELLLGGVVGLGGLFGLAVQPLKLRQELGGGPFAAVLPRAAALVRAAGDTLLRALVGIRALVGVLGRGGRWGARSRESRRGRRRPARFRGLLRGRRACRGQHGLGGERRRGDRTGQTQQSS